MPLRTQPTARQQRLGTELRKLREHAGLSAREASELLGTSQAQISHMESGRAGVSGQRIRTLASHYACDNTALINALAAMAGERGKGWWNDYEGVLPQGFLDLAELEAHAAGMRTIRIVGMPGLLQTEAYARAMYSNAFPVLPPDDIEARVAHRVQRRAVFSRPNPPPYEAVVHEAALRMPVGGRKTRLEQLAYLLEMLDAPHITIRVMPFAVDEFAGTDWSMLYLGGEVTELDTVHLDPPHQAIYLHAEAQLKRYRTIFAKAEGLALMPGESREFIEHLAHDL